MIIPVSSQIYSGSIVVTSGGKGPYNSFDGHVFELDWFVLPAV